MLNIQDMGARVSVLGDYNDNEYPYYNPSIAYDGEGRLRIAIRSCNFTVGTDGKWYLADGGSHAITKILYGYLDPITLTISDLVELKYSDNAPEETRLITGLEDARIFWREDGMHFSGVQIDTRKDYIRPALQAEYVLDEATNTLKYLRTMRLFTITRPEKNWMPTDKPGKFEYSYSPTEIYKDKEVYLTGLKPYNGFIRGGSQLLWQPKTNTYIGVTHSKHSNPFDGTIYDRYTYVHYFAEYDANGVLINLSDPFRLGTGERIEFVSGMVEIDDDLLFSFGIRDARLGVVRMPKSKALSMLKSYDGKESEPDGLYPPQVKMITEGIRRRLEREILAGMRR